jgi:hypothetical protein
MDKIPIRKTLLRQGINSRPLRTKILSYNKLCEKFDIDSKFDNSKLQKRAQKRYLKQERKEDKMEDKEMKKAMKELKYLERRSFFR